MEKSEALRLGRKLLRPEDYVRSLDIPNSDSVDFNLTSFCEPSEVACTDDAFDFDIWDSKCYYFSFFVFVLAYILFLIIVTEILLYIENINTFI